jgi:hypothetical protein
MKEKIVKYSALFISALFNPFFIPTIGLIAIMGYIPGVEFFSQKLKFIILSIVFFSTCIIPLIFIVLGHINQIWKKESNHFLDKILPYLFTCLSAFFGAQFIGKLPVPGIFRLFLFGICFMMFVLILISVRWKISEHSLALGGLLGVLLALNIKYGMNILWMLIAVILISGVVGSSRIFLERNSPLQVYTGYLTGFACMLLLIVFI